MRYRLLVVYCLVVLLRCLERLQEKSCRTVPADQGDADMPNRAIDQTRTTLLLL
jgi:hypothetical protein